MQAHLPGDGIEYLCAPSESGGGYRQSRLQEPADDLGALVAAIGVGEVRDTVGLRGRFEAAGGLLGLWHGGSEGLFEPGSAVHGRLEALFEVIARLLEAQRPAEVVDGPQAVLRLLGPRLAMEAQETFWTVALDARGRPLAVRCVARGTLTACLVHPREVFAPAIRCRAHALVLVHNHPSGDPEPSLEDAQLTTRLVEVGQLVGIPVVDHVVVGRGGFRSLGGAEAA